MIGRGLVLASCLWACATVAAPAAPPPAATTHRLDTLTGLEIVGGSGEIVDYRGRRALHLTPSPGGGAGDKAVIAILAGKDFGDGTIEVDVAGAPRATAPADSRGFIGVEFRLSERGGRGEVVYLRPTNGRAEDQLRRNRSVQYESLPEFPWHRLRKESPGVYETYADLETGAWTTMKIVVSGTSANLFVNGAAQPALVVRDLKLGASRGPVALWAHVSTEAYFSNLRVESAAPLRTRPKRRRRRASPSTTSTRSCASRRPALRRTASPSRSS